MKTFEDFSRGDVFDLGEHKVGESEMRLYLAAQGVSLSSRQCSDYYGRNLPHRRRYCVGYRPPTQR